METKEVGGGVSREIPLSAGYVALVDANDFERVSQHKWSAKVHKRLNKTIVYAHRSLWRDGKRTTQMLHQFIVQNFQRIDHRDHDGLNNQRHNLRDCTAQQNKINERHRGGQSVWRGVYLNKPKGNWRAQIRFNGKLFNLGYFKEEGDAALAYNFAAQEMFGEFAVLNTPEQKSVAA